MINAINYVSYVASACTCTYDSSYSARRRPADDDARGGAAAQIELPRSIIALISALAFSLNKLP